jgi:hypothetical protein
MEVWPRHRQAAASQALGEKLMSVEQMISAEALAKLFYQYHQTLAPIFECETSEAPASWEAARSKERKLMIATARLVLSDLASLGRQPETTTGEKDTTRSYFAKPGQAEWGC